MEMRIPTIQEYEGLIAATGGDNGRMHWEGIDTWVDCLEGRREPTPLSRMAPGWMSARYRSRGDAARRGAFVGFRPAVTVPDADAPASGEPIIIGTLYMDREPVPVPKDPTWNGDIAAYTPGARLEMREALCDPAYQVAGFRVGDVLVADRVLLNMISCEDIAEAVSLPLEIGRMLTLSTGHISRETAEMLAKEADKDAMGLCVYVKASGDEKYGWFIYPGCRPEGGAAGWEHVPGDLLSCIELARSHGCDILCLDRDGPVFPGLPTFDR